MVSWSNGLFSGFVENGRILKSYLLQEQILESKNLNAITNKYWHQVISYFSTLIGKKNEKNIPGYDVLALNYVENK